MATKTTISSHVGHSLDQDVCKALEQTFEGCDTHAADLGLVFLSPKYDLQRAAEWLRDAFSGPVLAGTTAGEISSSGGWAESSVSGAALFGVETSFASIADVHAFTPIDAVLLGEQLVRGDEKPGHTAALLLVDGLSKAEELISAYLHQGLGGIPVVGGSAGDDLKFVETKVFDGQQFVSNIASVVLVRSPFAIDEFAHQNFRPGKSKLVITSASPSDRIIHEINGEPAAQVYAREIGKTRADLDTTDFGDSPLLISTPSGHHVRSIRAIGDDDSIALYCAIDEGLIVTIGEPDDMTSSLSQLAAERRLDDSSLVVGFDCVLRRVAAQNASRLEELPRCMADVPLVGFSTYGEQVNGLHVNQTLTGLVFRSEDD